jgi:hypothetical protein
MGVQIREMPDDAARSLEKSLREAGLIVDVSECATAGVPDLQGSEIRCRRGRDDQVVRLYPLRRRPESVGS